MRVLTRSEYDQNNRPFYLLFLRPGIAVAWIHMSNGARGKCVTARFALWDAELDTENRLFRAAVAMMRNYSAVLALFVFVPPFVSVLS